MPRNYRMNVVVSTLVFFLYTARASISNPAIFDVTKFGATGDGKPQYDEDGQSTIGLSFGQAWQEACNSLGPSKVIIPKGKFVVAQVMFTGPCQSHVTVELQGTVIPDPDVSQFPNNELILFQQVEGASLTGTGSIDVISLPKISDDPEISIVFMDIMPSIILMNVTNFVVDGIRSLNPKAFHVLVHNSHNVTIGNVNLNSTVITPKTHSNAIYISSSSLVTVTNSFIRTGEDCITIAGGSSNISVTGMTCADGQGISIGAQPISTPEANVNGVRVRNCTFINAIYGARVNPRPHEKPGQVSDIIFEDLTMEKTQNPITINQDYPIKPNKPNYAKITNVHFRNIRGTTTTNTAVAFSCNKITPCDAIEVADINLTLVETPLPGKGVGLSAICTNAKVAFNGKHEGLNC